MRTSRRRSLLPVALAAVALFAASCGGDDGSATTTTKRSTTTTTEPVPIAFTPLTGEPLFTPGIAERPAVTVKVDNTEKGRPQAGLEHADVIIEERVEGGTVRFLAVFHSTDAESVGPIRSVRSSDPPIVRPFGGVFSYSGGIPAFDRLARDLPLVTVTESNHADAFHYRNDRQRPFKTYASTEKLRSYAAEGALPPGAFAPFLPEGQAFEPAGAEPAGGVEVRFGSRTVGEFEYHSGSKTWKRTSDGTPHVTASGERLAVANVVVQFVPYRATGQRDSSGSQVDQAVVVGEGEAWIFSEGKVLKGRWSKPTDAAMTSFTDDAGNPVALPPGKTWVSLPAVGSSVAVTAPTTTTTSSTSRSSTTSTARD